MLSREQILSHVWGYDDDPGSNVVDVHVRYLRQKLGAERIRTVRGAGYRLVTRPSASGGTVRQDDAHAPPSYRAEVVPHPPRAGQPRQ